MNLVTTVREIVGYLQPCTLLMSHNVLSQHQYLNPFKYEYRKHKIKIIKLENLSMEYWLHFTAIYAMKNSSHRYLI